jgi:hypothetical protein
MEADMEAMFPAFAKIFTEPYTTRVPLPGIVGAMLLPDGLEICAGLSISSIVTAIVTHVCSKNKLESFNSAIYDDKTFKIAMR